VQRVLDGLREGGHFAKAFDGDMRLPKRLKTYQTPQPDGRPSILVFNLAYGIQGDARYTHIPGMLELAGVPYTGAEPLGHAVSLDKVVAKILLRNAEVPTPRSTVMRQPGDDGVRFRYPLVVKPRHESTSYGLRLVRDRGELQEAVEAVVTNYRQPAIVEEFVPGREFCVCLVGNDPIEVLPVVELVYPEGAKWLYTWDDKYHKSPDEPEKICPATLDPALRDRLGEIAIGSFRACYCRDYAKVDIRLDERGEPQVIEINSMASLGPGGSYVLAAEEAGYSFGSLVCRIVDVAHLRYFGVPAPRPAREQECEIEAATAATGIAAGAGQEPLADNGIWKEMLEWRVSTVAPQAKKLNGTRHEPPPGQSRPLVRADDAGFRTADDQDRSDTER
jgi:D-alanine-D-alanine ligase